MIKKSPKTEQYDKARTENPVKEPGPQHYWKSPKYDIKNKKSVDNTPQEGDEKVYFMNREKTDKRISKPMKMHVF